MHLSNGSRRPGRRRRADPAPPDVGGAAWTRALRRVEQHRHYLDPFLGRIKRERHLRLAREWGALRRDGRLLKTDLFEEAAGPDAFLGELHGEAGLLVGMDVSAAVVESARGRATAPFHGIVADARRLPYADGAFATVISTSTLDHFPDPRDLGVSLRELRRVIEPNGRLLITLDNRQNLLDPLLRLLRRLGALPYFVGRSYRIGELRAELEAAGFVVDETTAILHNPRLMAVGLVRLAGLLRLRSLRRAVERLLLAAQRLERSRWRYFTGSFVAALAHRPPAATESD
jgi:SAM-dependent methyltransferase